MVVVRTNGSRAASTSNDPLMAIGEAAKLLGVSTSTLRAWDRQGLLKPRRTLGGHRRYARSEVLRAREHMGDSTEPTS